MLGIVFLYLSLVYRVVVGAGGGRRVGIVHVIVRCPWPCSLSLPQMRALGAVSASVSASASVTPSASASASILQQACIVPCQVGVGGDSLFPRASAALAVERLVLVDRVMMYRA